MYFKFNFWAIWWIHCALKVLKALINFYFYFKKWLKVKSLNKIQKLDKCKKLLRQSHFKCITRMKKVKRI
jgi:hypothetical protein